MVDRRMDGINSDTLKLRKLGGFLLVCMKDGVMVVACHITWYTYVHMVSNGIPTKPVQ
jgi:hypothetical protein